MLFFTRSDDHGGVDRVAEALRARGRRVARLDTDLFPTDLLLTYEQDAHGLRARLALDFGDVDLRDVSAVWYRRFHPAARLPSDLDPQHRHAAALESRTALLGLLHALPPDVFVMDPWGAIRQAAQKPRQLALAPRVGLRVPPTLVTNDPAAVREFARHHPGGLVIKTMSSFEMRRGGAPHADRLRETDHDELDGLDLCPMMFQARVSSALEIRAAVVGRRVLVAAAETGASAHAHTDRRRDSHARQDTWRPHALPAAVEAGLLSLAGALGLNFGTADLIVTPEGEHVFLEINPAGEFLWLETSAGLPICAAIASVLVDPAARREASHDA